MKRLILLVLVSLVILAVPNPAGEPDKEIVIVLGKASYIPYQDEYEKMLYPTVRISSPNGVGTGVILKLDVGNWKLESNFQPLTSTFIILTAAHVVGNETIVNVEFYHKDTKSTKIDASVVITDTAKDLALLKLSNIQHLISNIYSARLAPRDYTPYIFTPIYTVGCSLGLPPRPSSGILSALGVSAVEISAPVLPGNSGGPVYDARTFEVIGIAVWVKVYQYQLVTTMAGIVPINQIYELLEKVKIQNPKNQIPNNNTNSKS